MQVTINQQSYGPSNELRFRFRKLCEIAAAAKVSGQTELFEQAKSLYDSLASQYNAQARPKKRGFWGQFVDNLTNTETSVHIQGPMESELNYTSNITQYTTIYQQKKEALLQMLNSLLEDWKRGSDMLSSLGM